MRIISILGSPRKKGNTATILSWVEAELKTVGHEVERINLVSKKLNGCIGCEKCKDNQNEPGCVQKDDGIYIIDRLMKSDVAIFASPLYYWGFSAQMKTLIDRCHCLWRGKFGSPEHTSFIEGQRQALILTAADQFENNADLILTTFQRIISYNKAYSAGQLFILNCSSPAEFDEEIRVQTIKFANQVFDTIRSPYSLLIPGGAPNLVKKLK